MPEAETCQWCSNRMPVRRRRGAERRFCATPCRRAFDKATRKLGQETADEKFPAPGALRSRSGEARALHVEAKSDDLVSDSGTLRGVRVPRTLTAEARRAEGR